MLSKPLPNLKAQHCSKGPKKSAGQLFTLCLN
jgi:hypothetical protein